MVYQSKLEHTPTLPFIKPSFPTDPQNSGWPPGSPTSSPSPSCPLTFFRCSFCLSRNSSRLRSSSRRARASWMCALPTFSVSGVTACPLPGPVCHPHFTSQPSHPPSAFQPGTELDHSPSTYLLTRSPLQRLRLFQETLMALLPIWGWLELTLLQGVKGGPQGTAKQKSRSASRHAAGAGCPSWPMVLLFWREGPKPYSL